MTRASDTAPETAVGPDTATRVGGHTDGPWWATNTVSVAGMDQCPCVVDQFNCVVAICFDDGFTVEEMDRHARLIASAPALLEALERLERYLRDTPHHNAIEAAHARKTIALARATPEQQS